MKNRHVKIDWETFSEANRMVNKFKSKYSFEGYLKNRRILKATEWVIGIIEREDKNYVVLDIGCGD